MCDFCQVSASGMDNNYRSRTNSTRASRITRDCGAFFLTPTLGALHPTHALAVLKEHQGAFLPRHPNILSRLVEECEDIPNLLLFEHGVKLAKRGANCGIDHAHIHLLSLPIGDILTEFVNMTAARKVPLTRLIEESAARNEYLYVTDSATHVWLAEHGLESQLVRKIIGRRFGIEWDWKKESSPAVCHAGP